MRGNIYGSYVTFYTHDENSISFSYKEMDRMTILINVKSTWIKFVTFGNQGSFLIKR
jgi:hypothetical protein